MCAGRVQQSPVHVWLMRLCTPTHSYFHVLSRFSGGVVGSLPYPSLVRIRLALSGRHTRWRSPPSSWSPEIVTSRYRFVRLLADLSLQGPSSLAFDEEGSLYFTDSGALGETTLQAPQGSCFVISGPAQGQILRPLARSCLSLPWVIAVSTC